MANLDPHFDWMRVARNVLTSRALDELEESELHPKKKIVYQFSAKGHELVQVLAGCLLDNPRDAASAYYRSRPLLLTLGLSLEDALAGPLGKSGGYSDGRDIGVVCNLPSTSGPVVLPMAGDVGSQYTPAAGWAEAIRHRQEIGEDSSYDSAIAVVLGGEGSVATNGFWSSLTLATTLGLPMLFIIEDNGFAISVPSDKQTPGGNIAANLRSFRNLHVIDGDGSNPRDTASCLFAGFSYVRSGTTPALVRLRVPRLCGHSGQDTQAYKSREMRAEENTRDPIPILKKYLVPTLMSDEQWASLEQSARDEVARALEQVLRRAEPDPRNIEAYAFSQQKPDGSLGAAVGGAQQKVALQKVGGLAPSGYQHPVGLTNIESEGPRINMVEGVRKTLARELSINPHVLVLGEDVGKKGGVHSATLGLQEEFGQRRVYNTSLSEEGIIGRSVGMAYAGMLPVPEIQFRKYADPATEQLNNCGTVRWRTANAFAAPIVVRTAGGHSRYAGDPWHSVCGEAIWLHQCGWNFVMPSNVEDAVGLLRTALRGNDPIFFFEHRALLDANHARRQYPGDEYVVPLGSATLVQEGTRLTVVTWGAMVECCVEAAKEFDLAEIEILDLRSLRPWDKERVFESVAKTQRCLIVHEDNVSLGFGAEIAAVLADEMFQYLDAPIKRVATPDIPIPFNVNLMRAVIPTVEKVILAMKSVLEF